MTDETSEEKEENGTLAGEEVCVNPEAPDRRTKSLDQKQLATAERLFEAGDYKGVRQLVSELTNSSDPQIVQAARELKRRVLVDPVQIAVIVLCSAVFLAIAITYTLR